MVEPRTTDRRLGVRCTVLRCTVLRGTVLLCTVLAAAAPVAGQKSPETPSAEEILARHIEARGGAEAWARVQALEVRGTYAALSEEADFTLWRQRPKSYRFDYGILGERATEAYDGGSGWMRSPVEGWPWAVPMNAAQRKAVRSAAEFDSPLMDAAAKGHTVELVGRSEFDGIPTWELKVTLAPEDLENGGAQRDEEPNEETWHLDAETYLPVARIAPAADFGRAVGTQEIFYDDYREVEGVKFPFFLQSEYFIRLNIWTVDSIEINPPIPEGLFERPGPEGMERLRTLAGTWKVEAESRSNPRAPWSDDGVLRSVIVPRLGGALLEERLTLRSGGRPVQTLRTLSWDRFRNSYRLTHTDDLSHHTNVFEGGFPTDGAPDPEDADSEESAEGATDDPSSLVLTNLDTGTTLEIGPRLHSRYVISEIEADGFRVEGAVSTDGGESWFVDLRLKYTRTE